MHHRRSETPPTSRKQKNLQNGSNVPVEKSENASSNAPLFVYVPLLVFYLYVLRQYEDMYGSSSQLQIKSKVYTILKRFHFCFFTGWNLGILMFFLVVAILDALTAKIKHFSPPVRKLLKGFRHYLFHTIVFPCSCIVSFIFWTFFVYDREIIFPASVDEFYPLWLNHSVHTVILIPLVVENLFAPAYQKGLHSAYWSRCVKGMTLYMVVYLTVYLYVYFKHDIWLYPIYERLTWPQRVVLFVFVYLFGIGSMFLALYVRKFELKKRGYVVCSIMFVISLYLGYLYKISVQM